jgi:hypothetical protein
MPQEILINWSPQESRVAVVEHGAVQELHVERSLERGLVGNVYLGKVVRVLPGMQSAFIEPRDRAEQPGNRRHADAGFTDQHRVVLGAPGQDLHRAPDLFVAPDDRVDLALLGRLGQVARVFLQRVIALFGAGAVGGASAPR